MHTANQANKTAGTRGIRLEHQIKFHRKMSNLENESLILESERGSCSGKGGSFHASEYNRLAGKLPGEMIRAASAVGGVRFALFSITPVISLPTGV